MKGKSKRQSAKNNNTTVHTDSIPAELKEEMILQFGENEVSVAAISEKVKQSYKESGSNEELKEVRIYVKPEDNRAYYVANGEIQGSVELVTAD